MESVAADALMSSRMLRQYKLEVQNMLSVALSDFESHEL